MEYFTLKDWIELAIAAVSGLNLYLHLIVHSEVVDLKALIYQKFMSHEEYDRLRAIHRDCPHGK